VREGVGVVEDLHCPKELKEVLVVDPPALLLPFQQLGDVGDGSEVVQVGEELTLFLVLDD
jgi:hypothetical protein